MKGPKIMTTMTVTTWADGFGAWHVRVDEPGNTTGDAVMAHRVALAAIGSELDARDAADLSALTLTQRSRTSQDGTLSTEWVEAWPTDDGTRPEKAKPWPNHTDDNGVWCRWSNVNSVSELCPAGCKASKRIDWIAMPAND